MNNYQINKKCTTLTLNSNMDLGPCLAIVNKIILHIGRSYLAAVIL